MKRYIRSSFDLNKLVTSGQYSEEDNITVKEAIDAMCYEVYDNSSADIKYGNISLNEAVNDVIRHLDDPDIYGLKCGKDYSREQVREVMDTYF